jgi:Uma2 family endonuclease
MELGLRPSPPPCTFRIVYEVAEPPSEWLLDEADMPETPLHDLVLRLLCLVLDAWIVRTGRSAHVARNLACRWNPEDGRVGVDPDVALIEPYAPSITALGQLRLWEPGHVPPRIAFEVVSATTAAKDYLEVGARYARLGTREVWVFDPLLLGPKGMGGPFMLSGWRRNGAVMERVHAGSAPAFSEELGAWLVTTDGGERLRIADDRDGSALWLTGEEAAVAKAEEQRRAAEEQRRATEEQTCRAEAAEAELARLRAELGRK